MLERRQLNNSFSVNAPQPHAARRGHYRVRPYHGDYFIVRHLHDFIAERVPRLVTQGKRIADIGCGEQPFRSPIELAGGRYWGIDMEQNTLGTVDVLATAAQAPFSDGSFDLVLCTEVLEHVPDAAAALRELSRIVKVAGLVVCSVPFLYPLHEEPHDYSRLTVHHFRNVAERNGLEIIELRKLGTELEVIATF